MTKLKHFAWLLAPASVACSAVAGATFDRMNADGANTTPGGIASILGLFAAVAVIGVVRWWLRPGVTKSTEPVQDNQRALEALADEAHDAMRQGNTSTVRNKADAADVLKKEMAAVAKGAAK